MPWLDFDRGACAASEEPREMNGALEGACALAEEETALWKPLVLLIPLRLGLSDINEAYFEPLKQCFMMPQSLGVIGGKPNSAHYFIGFVGKQSFSS
ncbi:cysteine protease ATG4B-like [Sinocyclocheilus rhinocerous]|uniref:cysteine protease ATG4B-like n=1 Tax=Sinocyclocheilus rhinocerous TaxID=307959 RepID=UPI0007BAC34E|nr:PREDICTED: cysteine protease ATG4B-like [Sinocyclocheilus rhinocerous]